ncbi:hypothetical protein LTR27_003716 [Elasticomyces elasticus]|nr:hypothetical protein LTR27_003716 [Elasticomyces elasticus]
MPSIRSSKRTTRVRAERAKKEQRHQRALRKLARRAAEIERCARATTPVDPFPDFWFTPEAINLPTFFVEDPDEEEYDPFTDYISLPEAEFERIVQEERSKMEIMLANDPPMSWRRTMCMDGFESAMASMLECRDWAAIEGGEALWLEHILAAHEGVEVEDDAGVCMGALTLEGDANEVVQKQERDNAIVGAGMANMVMGERSLGWDSPLPEDSSAVPSTQQPQGRWEFLANDDRDQAHLNFGDQAMFGFTGITHSTAAQIWRVREILRECGDEDVTMGIGLVWVPFVTEKELRDQQSMRWTAPEPFETKRPAKRSTEEVRVTKCEVAAKMSADEECVAKREVTAVSADCLSFNGISEEKLEAKGGHGDAEGGQLAFVMEERSMSCE